MKIGKKERFLVDISIVEVFFKKKKNKTYFVTIKPKICLTGAPVY